MEPTPEIEEHHGLTPKRDQMFLELASRAYAGKVPVYFAAIPLVLCVPFDLDYRPDRHPAGRHAIQRAAESWYSGDLHPLRVYPRGKWFLVSEDYVPLFAALLGMPEYVPCYVFGRPDDAIAKHVDGPMRASAVRKLLAGN